MPENYVGEATVRVGAETQDAERDLRDGITRGAVDGADQAGREGGRRFAGFAKQWALDFSVEIGTTLATNLGAELNQAFASAVDIGPLTAQIENSIPADLLTERFGGSLRDEAGVIADAMGGTVEEGLELVNDLFDAGFDDIDFGGRLAAQIASASSDIDAEGAVAGFREIFDTFNVGEGQLQGVADQVLFTAQQFRSSFPEIQGLLVQFGESFPDAEPEQFFAQMLALQEAGFSTSEAFDALSSSTALLQEPTEEMNRIYQRLSGQSIESAISSGFTMQDVFADLAAESGRSAAALGLVGEEAEQFDAIAAAFRNNGLADAYGELSGASGVLADASERVQQEAGERVARFIQRARNQLVLFFAVIIDNTGPLFDLAEAAAAMVGRFIEWEGFLPVITGLLTALAGGLVAFVIPAIWAKAAAWAATAAAVIAANAPIILIIAAVALLAAGIVFAYQNVDFFRVAVDFARDALFAAWGFIVNSVIPALIDFGGQVTSLSGVWGIFRTVAGVALRAVGAIISAQVNFWTTIFRVGFNILQSVFGVAFGVISTLVSGFVSAVQLQWQFLSDVVIPVVQFLVDLAVGLFTSLVDTVLVQFDLLASGVDLALGFLRGGVDRGLNAITSPFEAFIDLIQRVIDAIGRIPTSIDLPSIPGVGGFTDTLASLNPFARGGFVNAPTAALIGEAGPELVLPLSRPNRMRQLLDGPGGDAVRDAIGGGSGSVDNSRTYNIEGAGAFEIEAMIRSREDDLVGAVDL